MKCDLSSVELIIFFVEKRGSVINLYMSYRNVIFSALLVIEK